MKEKRNIPLTEVAKATGIARRTLYAWQNNNIDRFDTDVIEKLCQYFGVKLSDLLEYIPADDPQPKQKTARK